jgi:hypothetical protein
VEYRHEQEWNKCEFVCDVRQIRRVEIGPARNSSPIMHVQTESHRNLSDLCHMRCVREPRTRARRTTGSSARHRPGGVTPAARTALGGSKKRGRIPRPSRNDPKVHFFFLATANTAYQRHSPHATSSRPTINDQRAFARTQPKTTVVVSGARLSSLMRENRGFAALPRGRCACSFSHCLGRKHFYSGLNRNWCRLNLFPAQGC